MLLLSNLARNDAAKALFYALTGTLRTTWPFMNKMANS